MKKVYRVEKGLPWLKKVYQVLKGLPSFKKVYRVLKGLPGCGINRDDFLIEFIWKESLDIGLILDWFEGILDRYGEMVRIWKDSLDIAQIWME